MVVRLSDSHKNLRNPSHGLDVYLSKRPNHEEDCANFCGLVRKAELYTSSVIKSSDKYQVILDKYIIKEDQVRNIKKLVCLRTPCTQPSHSKE